MKPYLVFLCLVAAGVSPVTAFAQGADARVVAESLFRDGRRLMDAGQIAEGCRKLEASERLDSAPGTMLALATCHEEEGRSATAWSEFNQALSVARRDNRADRARFASEHIATLEPVLPRLAVDVPPENRVRGLVLVRNSAELNEAAWGVDLPADPGTVVIEARAPGRVPWRVEARATPGTLVRVSIPLLAVQETPKVPSPLLTLRDTSARAYHPARRTAAIAVGGASAAALGIGIYAGVRTLQKRSSSDAECPTVDFEAHCTETGVTDNRDAHTLATVSNVAIGAGVVGLFVAGYLWFSAGSPPAPARKLGFTHVRILPTAELHSVGGQFEAVW